MKFFLPPLITVFLILLCAEVTFSQSSCLNNDEVKRMLTQISSQEKVSPNKKLRDDLLKWQDQSQEQFKEIVAQSHEKLIRRVSEQREKNEVRLCQTLKEFGWPTKSLVGGEGVAAALFLLENSTSLQLQIDLFPVVVAAVKHGDLERADFAGFFDRVRVRSGLTQLFGTQATVLNGFLMLDPIEAEAQVDARRSQYGLPPLADYLRYLEYSYQIPLVRSPVASRNQTAETAEGPNAKTLSTASAGVPVVAEDEVVRIDTRLVNLNVSVFSNSLKAFDSTLGKEDFTVLEDGHEETITFFEASNEPFDLVLLIDLSGSTSGKRELIRKTTQRFIEAARSSDKLAIVTFSETATVVSSLTGDRANLLDSIKNMKGEGGSHVWDAVKFAFDQIIGPRSLNRRKAIVLMSDGADNALLFRGGGSQISFADLLETVRRQDTLIIPIYLDTEGDEPWNKRLYENARNTLALLAKESGGLYYKARKIEDLNGVYEQVINDLGKVYSLGYRPTNQKRDGLWRRVKIQTPNHPDLVTHTRTGYYAN